EAWGHRLRALALRRLGRRRAARAAAAEAVRLAPGSAESWNVLSMAELGLPHPRRVGAAARAARKALEVAPESSAGHGAMAGVALNRGSPREAEAHCRAMLAADPDDAYAMNLLGVALKRQLKRRSALVAFAAATELDPGNATARDNLDREL